MTIKRLILGLLTVLLMLFFIPPLLASWGQPQIQSRLELYQTNLLLHASEWREKTSEDTNLDSARDALIGKQPLKAAQEQYEEARKFAESNLEKAKAQLQILPDKAATPAAESLSLAVSINRQEDFINQLDLRLGILQVRQGQTETALKTWKSVSDRMTLETPQTITAKTADVLTGLWSDPPRILPNAQQNIQKSLDGWFRYQALNQLYKLQQRQEVLTSLEAAEQQVAQQAVLKLAIVGAIPTFGFLIGVGLLIFLLIQLAVKRKESLLALNGDVSWSTPWDGETILQVFVVGFFGMQLFVSALLLPVALKLLNLNPKAFDLRSEALLVLVQYLLVALGALLVVYFSVKSFSPLPEGWFWIKLPGNWFFWGLGGYLVAIPLVIVVSLINQLFWQGQGGSNRLLSLALEGKDTVALAIFFFTAAIAAPLFEEFLFRGFLLASLTRYMPVWAAVVSSSFLFAIAHLSLSEVLPLTTLGIVLGVVYTRSRNLLAPMFLHSLWNSGTLVSLFILGSS